MINMLNALVEKGGQYAWSDGNFIKGSETVRINANARKKTPNKPQWQKWKMFLMGSTVDLTQLKNESVNRSIDKNYPNWNTKKKKCGGRRGGGDGETRTGHLRTGINIKWYNICEIETPEVEDTGQVREYQSGRMPKINT